MGGSAGARRQRARERFRGQVRREVAAAGAVNEVGEHGAQVTAVEDRERLGVRGGRREQLLVTAKVVAAHHPYISSGAPSCDSDLVGTVLRAAHPLQRADLLVRGA